MITIEMSGDKKQNKPNGDKAMSRQDDLDTLHNWTTPEHLKPLTFWQAFSVFAVMAIAGLIPFTLVLTLIAWLVAHSQ